VSDPQSVGVSGFARAKCEMSSVAKCEMRNAKCPVSQKCEMPLCEISQMGILGLRDLKPLETSVSEVAIGARAEQERAVARLRSESCLFGWQETRICADQMMAG
jgi:hypothetical protein